MSCFFRSNDPARRKSKELDKKIGTWMSQYCKAIKLLLLGAGESGKTTILKQMKIIHDDGFTEKDREAKREEIRINLLEAIKDLGSSMKILHPPEHLQDPSNMASLDYILQFQHYNQSNFPEEFYDHTKKLWNDAGIQQCYLRSSEFTLMDSAKYFMEKIDVIRKENYVPSDQDILCCRRRTADIQKMEFQVRIPKQYGGGVQTFWMFDVGGQRGERRKWIQVFDGITAILFLVACSGFDIRLREDNETNRLQEALTLFQDIWLSRFLRDSGIILFLNKQDLLKEKVEKGVQLADYFPDYIDYVLKSSDGRSDDEYQKARCFIRDKFLQITLKSHLPRRFSTTDLYYDMGQEKKPRKCFWHFTTATDTDNVKLVFNSIHSMIIEWNLDKITPN